MSETEQLFAALGDAIPDFEPTDWEFAAEEELIFFCGDAPAPRSGLRAELFVEFDRVERSREKVSRLTIIAGFMIAAGLVMFGPTGDATQAKVVAQVEPVRARQFPMGSAAIGPPVLVKANSQADSWALVEAYSTIRQKHSNVLTGNLGGGPVQ